MNYRWIKPKNNHWMVTKKTTWKETGQESLGLGWFKEFGPFISQMAPDNPPTLKGN